MLKKKMLKKEAGEALCASVKMLPSTVSKRKGQRRVGVGGDRERCCRSAEDVPV